MNHRAGGTGCAGGASAPPIFGRSRSKSFSIKRSSVISGTPKFTDLPPDLNQETTDESTSFRKDSLFLKSLKRKVHPIESLFSFRVPKHSKGRGPSEDLVPKRTNFYDVF